MHYDEFIPMFEEQYPQFPWKEVEVSTLLVPAGLFLLVLENYSDILQHVDFRIINSLPSLDVSL